MEADTDAESLTDCADGMAQCIKNVGPGMLNGQEVQELAKRCFKFMDDSFQRSEQAEKARKAGAAGAPAELQEDDDDEDKFQDDEESCRRSLEEALGSVMKAAPADFLACLPECGQRMQNWLSVPKYRVVAFWLACDLLEHLREKSEPVWQVFMPALFQALGDKDPDLRIAACYAVNLAAPLDRFAEAAPEAYRRLAQILGGKAPKKRDDKAKVAFENAVAALLALVKAKPTLCPPEIQAWQLVVSKLPLKEDEEEAKKVHKIIATLVSEQHAGLLGPDGSNLGKILSALAEVYRQENVCDKATEEQIKRIFQLLSKEHLVKIGSSFTEKQQRKIEKILTSAAVAA